MAAVQTKTLNMVFVLEGTNKELTVGLTDPKEDLTKAAVQSVMNDMIAKKALVKAGAFVASIKEANIRQVQVTELA